MSLLLLLNSTQSTAPADLELLYKPVRTEVALLIRDRLYTRGQQADDFTSETEPTETEVIKIIDLAAANVAAVVGIDIPEITWPMARGVVALRAAIKIEMGSRKYSTQRVQDLREDYKEDLKALVAAVQAARDGGDPGEVDDRVGPVGSFPPAPCDDLTYWHTPGSEVPWS